MARIRTVKPEFWSSEQIMELSMIARLAFIGLWNFCDDGGVHPASFKTLKAEIFPSDDIAIEAVSALVAEMVAHGLVAEFQASGKSYWHVTGWKRHQKIDKPTYRHPQASASTSNAGTLADDSSSNPGGLGEDSASGAGSLADESATESKGVESKGVESNGEDKDSRPLGVSDLVAEGVVKKHADDWLKSRRAKRAPLTATAWDGVKAEAAKAGISPAEAVQIAATNSWQGFKASWLSGKAGTHSGGGAHAPIHSGFDERDYGTSGKL